MPPVDVRAVPEMVRVVHVGGRVFEVKATGRADGRAEVTVTVAVDGQVRSEVRAVVTVEDAVALGRVLATEFKGVAMWSLAPARSFADMIEQVRRTHANAYRPWTKEEETRLVGRFRSGVAIPALAGEFGRSPGGVRGRLEQLGEIAPVRGISE